MHSDNGGEILNHHVMAFLGRKNSAPFVWRSRPRKSNNNAHVEEKNGSAGRQLFGEIRLDCPWLEKDLIGSSGDRPRGGPDPAGTDLAGAFAFRCMDSFWSRPPPLFRLTMWL